MSFGDTYFISAYKGNTKVIVNLLYTLTSLQLHLTNIPIVTIA